VDLRTNSDYFTVQH